MKEILKEGFARLGIDTDAQAYDRLETYYRLLDERNRVMNLTAIEGEENVARLHFLDCAALLKFADFAGKRVIDVGTGAGFPGLVLKILRPDISITLLDSLNKRVDFLRDTCSALGLDGVECVHARAEEIAPERRESYDICVSRAVARLNMLSELCIPYVKRGGVFLAMKGPDCADEVNEAKAAYKKLGAAEPEISLCDIPGTDITHAVVLAEKISPTPAGYPRKWGQIKKVKSKK